MNLNRVAKVHTLVSALADRNCPCVWPTRRAVDRLWLDIEGGVTWRTIRDAYRLGLVRFQFDNPYLIGSGDYFIGLSALGAMIAWRQPVTPWPAR